MQRSLGLAAMAILVWGCAQGEAERGAWAEVVAIGVDNGRVALISTKEVSLWEYQLYLEWLAMTGCHENCDVMEGPDADHRPKHVRSEFLSGDRAVCGVNWFDAKGFCGWRGGRLPTRREWLEAASLAAEAKWVQCSVPTVGIESGSNVHTTLRTRAAGILALLGHWEEWSMLEASLGEDVSEWCADDLDGSNMAAVLGGNWYFSGNDASVTHWYAKSYAHSTIGFRAVYDTVAEPRGSEHVGFVLQASVGKRR